MNRLNRRWVILVVAAVVGAGALGVAWRAEQLSAAAGVELAASQARTADLRAKIGRLQAERAANIRERNVLAGRVKDAERESAAARAATAVEAAAKAAALAKQQGEFSAWIWRTREHPAVQSADALSQREHWRWGNRAFFQAMAFTPQQVERWLDVEVCEYLQRTDVDTAAKALGLAPDDPVVAKFNGDIAADYERSLKAEFGESAWERWEAFRQERQAWKLAGGFGAMAAMAGVPIDTRKGELLARAILDATERTPKGEINNPCLIDWAKVDAQARTFLTGAQWELFRSAEAPGEGGGGSRFMSDVNQVLWKASRQDEAAGRGGAKPSGG